MKKLLRLWIFFLFVYLLTFVVISGRISFPTTIRNYFSLQAYSWLHGHLNLIVVPRDLADLSIYNHRAYLYWPPLPAIFALPFVFLRGLYVSDIFYTAFWASFGPVLFYLIINYAKEAQIIPKLSDKKTIFLTAFFGLGTVYYYLAVLGTVWFTSQVLSLLILLLSYIFLFKYVRDKKLLDYIIAIIFFLLSFWGRNTLILSLPIFLFCLIKTPNKFKKKLVLITLILVGFNVIIYGYFNYIRFGSFTENGFGYNTLDPKFINDYRKYGVTNIHYIPHNFYTYFINTLHTRETFPFITPDPEGNSIFSVSPFFLLLMGGVSRTLFKKKNSYFYIFLINAAIIISALLLFFGTGYFQFGYRYALDAIPLLILALAYVIDLFPKSFVIFLFIISVIINFLGTYWFYQVITSHII